VSGWAIKADGSAEFANITVGGSVNTQIIVRFVDGSSQRIYGGNYTFHNASTATVPGTWLALTPPSRVGSTYQPGVIGASVVAGPGTQPYLAIASPWDSSLTSDWASQINLGARGSVGSSAEIDMSSERITMNVVQSGVGSKSIEMHGTVETFDGDLLINGPNVGFASSSPTGVFTITPGGAAVVGQVAFNGVFLWNGYAVTGGTVAPGHWFALLPAIFANNFKDRNLGGTFPVPGYFIDAFGLVQLRGQITGGALSAIGSTVLTLPVGLRPSNTIIAAVASNGGTEVYGRIDINPNGTITWRGPTVVTGGVNWFTINASFYAEA
jgi:hypothetical protein